MTISMEQFDMLENLKGSLPEDTGSTYVSEEDYAIEEAPETVHSGRTYSVSVCSIMAYLIGVPRDNFGKNYKMSVYDSLEKNPDAKTIRCLCTIRSLLMRNIGSIYTLLHQGLKNLDTIPEYIDPELFSYLTTQKIRIVTGTQIKDMTEYIAIVNNHISNKINACARLFPAWVKWEYIKDLFLMPGGGKKDKIQSAVDRMKESLNSYPFACWINWPVNRGDAFVEDPENYLEPVTTGNVILNDKKFMVLLYRISGDDFTDFYRVYDADRATTDALSDYLLAHDNITLLVDCENSDPCKLCAMFDAMKELRARHLAEKAPQDPAMGMVRRIILFDDYHTVDAWDILSEYVGVEICHEEIERVLDHKSLVDIAMSVGACKEHFVNGVNSFMIASSDSDFWGLMRALPDCSFMVMGERGKLSGTARSFYEGHDVPVCLIDDFASDLSKIREGSLRLGIEKHLNNMLALNIDDALSDIFGALRMDMSQQERDNFRAGLARSLKLEISDRGDLRVRVTK